MKEGILPDTRVEPIIRDLLNMRYELLPYIYNLSYEVLSGIPMMRPLWYKHKDDRDAIGLGDAYYFGDSLLVAPVVEKGASSRDVYFPDGDFYCYFTKEKISGGGVKNVKAELDRVPVFVPAGGFVAKGPITQYIDTAIKDDFDSLTIEVYSGKDGTYALYEDDGISMGYTRGENTLTKFEWDEAKKELKASGTSTIFPGKKRDINVRILPENKEYVISLDYT